MQEGVDLTMRSEKYLCAFRGRRDYYQVPIALAEAGLLEEFVTDVYAKDSLKSIGKLSPARVADKLLARRAAAIPDQRVTCIWRSAVEEFLRLRLGSSPSETFAKLDQ